MDAIHHHEQMLVSYALDQMRQVRDLEVYGPAAHERGGVISFGLEGSTHTIWHRSWINRASRFAVVITVRCR